MTPETSTSAEPTDINAIAAGYVLGVESELGAVILEDLAAAVLERLDVCVDDARAIVAQARFDVGLERPDLPAVSRRAMAAARIIRLVADGVARRAAA